MVIRISCGFKQLPRYPLVDGADGALGPAGQQLELQTGVRGRKVPDGQENSVPSTGIIVRTPAAAQRQSRVGVGKRDEVDNGLFCLRQFEDARA